MFIIKIVNIIVYLWWKLKSPPEKHFFRRAFPFFDPDSADYPPPVGRCSRSGAGVVVHGPGVFLVSAVVQQAQVPQQTGTPPKQTVQAQPA
jgi:hypothetical protein